MFLLSADQILRSVSERTVLDIQPFDSTALGASFYYFALGQHYCRFDTERNDWQTLDLLALPDASLVIGPGEFVLIRSYERFWCSQHCLGVIGARSTLTRRGLALQYSPFIDPTFPGSTDIGYLELGIKNQLPRPTRLKFREHIGKVSFFNVSDSALRDSVLNPSQSDFRRRARTDKPIPLYDDDPVEGWQLVERGEKAAD